MKNTENTETKYKIQREKGNNAKHSKTGLVASSYDTRPGNEVRLFYNAPEL